ncbi:MAG: hypothetical protein R3264_17600 [Anaerolineae bacterium]|nr:hypothetical protein [Anaerolineae bacterium]
MGVVIGFVIGFVLGSQVGPLDLDEISQAWDEIKSSEETQALVAGGSGIVLQMFQQGLGIVGQVVLKR